MKVCSPNNFVCPHNTAVALGTFDGLHLGHQRVIEATMGHSDLPCVVLSIVPPIEKERLLLADRRHELLENMGVDYFLPLPLNEIRHLSPEEFFVSVLVNTLKAKRIVCGFNFRFGAGAAGDTAMLLALCRRYDVALQVIAPVEEDGQPISSSRIRKALQEGDLPLATKMLGRPFGFDAPVCHGQHLGHKLGFPTINQVFPPNMTLPKNGVYAGKVTVNRQTFGGVCNVGRHPTVGDADRPLAETHLLDFDGDLYGQNVRLELIGFLRKEEKFPSLKALQAAIEKDVTHARTLLTE